MCGRYYIDMEEREPAISSADEAAGGGAAPPTERREIAPGQMVNALIAAPSGIQRTPMLWGFGSDRGGLIINARMETAGERPTFSGLYRRQRCALPASGYYEWRRGDRQRFAIRLADAGRFYLAGLYRTGPRGLEFVVLTQAPTPEIAAIHNRMPVMLRGAAEVRAWLGGAPLEPRFIDELILDAEGDEQLRMDL